MVTRAATPRAVVILLLSTFNSAAITTNIESHIAVDTLTCRAIALVISSASSVYYPNSTQYASDIHHWLPSSEQQAACSVEPGTTEDVRRILNVLAFSPSYFAIKSGGHATNVGISSTTGIQISMTRFNTTTVNKDMTVTIGLGQTWDDVYFKLNGTGLAVAGGRLPGVGTGGFVLGGGYNWLANAQGMTVDTVVSYELVLPTGQLVTASSKSYPDLFAGLKGGYNNFGIVVRATLKAFPLARAYTSLLVYDNPSVFPAVWEAIVDFHHNNDDEAGSALSQYGIRANGTRFASVVLTYNAPSPPPGFFDQFTLIQHVQEQLATGDLASILAQLGPVADNGGLRGEYGCVGVSDITVPLINAAVNLTNYYGPGGQGAIADGSATYVAIEPFSNMIINPNRFSTAWPHDTFNSPLNPVFFWPNDPKLDAKAHAVMADWISGIRSFLTQNGLNPALPVYPNYAAASQTIEELYGLNLEWLKPLRRKYDPRNTMLRAPGRKFI